MKSLPGDLQAFPIRYLGLPLTIRKPKKCDLQHLVDKIAAGLLTWTQRHPHVRVLVDNVRIKYSKAAVPCHEACFTMLFVQWMRAELEYFCLAAYKGSQSVVAQET